MKTIELPTPMEDIMITYKKTFYRGVYGTKEEVVTITKRGFYSDLFNTFSIPPNYKKFNGVLLPDSFGGDHILPEKVIKWEYCKD